MSGTAEAESHAVLLSYRGGPTLRPRQPSTTPSPLVMDDRETTTGLSCAAHRWGLSQDRDQMRVRMQGENAI